MQMLRSILTIYLIAAISPAFAAECVTASASSGYAMPEMLEPKVERSCPACSSMKSRLRQSGADVLTR